MGTKNSSSKPKLTNYYTMWQGSWQTSYGELRLHQKGNQVYGDYANKGNIKATYNSNKNTLTGTFTNNKKKGTFSFQKNGNTFSGTWKWSGGGGKWTGSKKSSSKPKLTTYKSSSSKPTIKRTNPRPTIVLLDSLRGWDWLRSRTGSRASFLKLERGKTIAVVGRFNQSTKKMTISQEVFLSNSDQISGWSWDGKTATFTEKIKKGIYLFTCPFDGKKFGTKRSVFFERLYPVKGLHRDGNVLTYILEERGKMVSYTRLFNERVQIVGAAKNYRRLSKKNIRGLSLHNSESNSYFIYQNGKNEFKKGNLLD